MSSSNLSETVEASDLSRYSISATVSTPSSTLDQRGAPPRVVEFLSGTVPYAQLCFSRHASKDRLCIVMIGKMGYSGSDATAGSHHRLYKSLAIEGNLNDFEEGNEEESPTVDHISSSLSSDTQNDSRSSADIVELEDLGWASNGWDDLRLDSSSLSSEGSSGWDSTIDNSTNDSHTKDLEDDVIFFQGAQWVDETQNSYNDDEGLCSDAWRLLGEASVADHSNDNTDTMFDILDAWGCGRLICGIGFFRDGTGTATLKPYHRALRRQRHAPNQLSASAVQPVAPTSNEYSSLV